jgi:hypothetical protein
MRAMSQVMRRQIERDNLDDRLAIEAEHGPITPDEVLEERKQLPR